MEDEFFNFDSSFEDLPDPLNETPRYHITNVWHEMGHLIGHAIAKRIGYDFGKIDGIDFGESPKINIVNPDYAPKGLVVECIDSYGYPNMCFDNPDDIKRIASSVKDRRKSLLYMFYLLAGGYFNIYIVEPNPTDQDIVDCYTDSKADENRNHIYARAGNDWSKVRRLAQIENWSYGQLVTFRRTAYNLLSTYKVFWILKPELTEIDCKFNGQKLDEAQTNIVYSTIEQRLDEIEAAFWQDMETLIDTHEIK